MKVLSLQFSYDELISFCRFSQDFNPIHWDKTYARRTFFGEPVVHGAYAIQKCLALIQEEESFLKVIERLKVEFKKPIFCDRTYVLELEHNSAKTKIKVKEEGGTVCLSATLFLLDNLDNQSEEVEGVFGDSLPANNIEERSETDIAQYFQSPLPKYIASIWKKDCPSEIQALPDRIKYSVSVASYIVGMRCPGLFSIFTAFDFKFVDNMGRGNFVATHRYSHGLTQLAFKHSLFYGFVEVMDRPRPVQKTALSDMPKIVSWRRKKIKTALILGGSSGLGRSLSQLLLKNNTFVYFSYCNGIQDGKDLVAEAKEQNLPLEMFHYDALNSGESKLSFHLNLLRLI